MKNYIIRYGIYGASVSIALGILNWLLLAKPFGPGPSQAVGYISIAVSLLCIPLGIKYFRDKLNKGKVSIGNALKIGTGITLVSSVIMGLYGILFFAIEGDKFNEWQAKWMTEAHIEQARQQSEQMVAAVGSPVFQGLVMFAMVFIMGMIINLISSLILKK